MLLHSRCIIFLNVFSGDDVYDKETEILSVAVENWI